MELFWLEHKKLWRKKIVKICVLLCFVYYVIFGSILSFQWFGFGSSDDYTSAFGNNFDGYTVIKDSQEYALSFGGELTDETLQRIVSDYQQMEADGMGEELEKTDWQIVNSWLGTLYPELRDTSNYKTMISYVDPDKLTGFYERRQQVLDEFLESAVDNMEVSGLEVDSISDDEIDRLINNQIIDEENSRGKEIDDMIYRCREALEKEEN